MKYTQQDAEPQDTKKFRNNSGNFLGFYKVVFKDFTGD
jgi:hypothetical protein